MDYNALVICFHVGQTPGQPRGNLQEPRGNCTVLVFFFLAGEGSCIYTHRICLRSCDRQVLYLVPWSMCENELKAYKKNWIHLFVIFAYGIKVNIILSLVKQEKVEEGCYVLILTTIKRYHVVCDSILSPRERLFVINFMPFTQGLFDSPEKAIP